MIVDDAGTIEGVPVERVRAEMRAIAVMARSL